MLRFCCLWCCFGVMETWSFYAPKMKYYPNFGNTTYASFVTPYLKRGEIMEAQKNCTVSPPFLGLKSYAGYFTVRNTTTYRSHLFFWFFPAEDDDIILAPLILLLQHGTGPSTLLSVFTGNGPYIIYPNGTLSLGTTRLTKSFSVIYVDSPVGSGYSFTEDEIGFTYYKPEVSQLLFIMIKQFYLLFPETRSANFFICAESYSSSYVPLLAKTICQHNKRTQDRDTINLVGVTMGSAFLDPINMTRNYSDFFTRWGLIDSQAQGEFKFMSDKIYNLTKVEKFQLAYKWFDRLICGRLTNKTTIFKKWSNSSIFNYKVTDDIYYSDRSDHISKFVQSDYFRSAVHVNNFTFHYDYSKVLQEMSKDILRPVMPSLDHVLRYGVKVLIYHGEYDALIPYDTVVNHVKTLRWVNRLPFRNGTLRKPYSLKGQVIGYVKRYHSLQELMMIETGHLISLDQPWRTLRLLKGFLRRKIYTRNVTEHSSSRSTTSQNKVSESSSSDGTDSDSTDSDSTDSEGTDSDSTSEETS